MARVYKFKKIEKSFSGAASLPRNAVVFRAANDGPKTRTIMWRVETDTPTMCGESVRS